MNLSKNESKCRIKLIQEYHFDKTQQRILDELVSKSNITYKSLILSRRRGEVKVGIINIIMYKLNSNIVKLGSTFSTAVAAVGQFSDALSNYQESVIKDELSRERELYYK